MIKTTCWVVVLLATILAMIASGCSFAIYRPNPTEDTLYLTPIPQSTLDAITITPPITTRLQAVIAACRVLGTTRLEFSTSPSVLSVEEMRLADAIQQTGFPGATSDALPARSDVWLVIFDGDYRIIPPDPMHTYTPEPPGHGCAAVIIVTNNGLSGGAGTLRCPTSP
jgi:hypothetical protein